jgi:YidC/Oxa1 family membrane protein insertase
VGEIGNLFNIIFTYPIFNGLVLLYHLFGDFALSIIVLTLVIKLVLFPLTLQQLKSMKATQALQPQMAEIRKKYAKDQQGQALAMQALYKEYGVNPVAGCLPLLVQLPVLYGLFYALNGVLRTSRLSDINAHLYPFVPHFSKFPDINLNWFTFINHSWFIPLGQPDISHILPILAGLATFVQLRMSMARSAATANANDPSAQSMKMMQYVMPFITVFFGWTFPAGLALYWTVSSIFQAVQQYFVTGWGSLLVVPNLKADLAGGSSNTSSKNKSNGAVSSKSYTGDRKRERALLERADEPEVEQAEDAEEGPVESQLRTVPRGGGSSQYNRRRQRGGSASARRRSSTQRSRG